MKKNEKKVSILTEENGQSAAADQPAEKKGFTERIKKPLIFTLMGIVCTGCLYLIFKPSKDKKQIENIGLNEAVPQPAEAAMQSDKQKAYEEEMLEEKEQQKRNAMTTLSDYWNEKSSDAAAGTLSGEGQTGGYGGSPGKSENPALDSYRNAQSALGSFYQNDNSETQQLRRQMDALREQLAEKEVPAAVSVDDQLALMEKSYQMAAKYLPSVPNTGGAADKNIPSSPVPSAAKKEYFASFTPTAKSPISALYRETSDTVFSAGRGKNSSLGFYTPGSSQQQFQPKNSVKACVHETQTITGEGSLRLRLLEPAQTSVHFIAAGTIITASAKLQAGRLDLKIASVELDGNIIAVDIIIYGLDGQQGIQVPYSAERNALGEMAGNMSQQTGTSLMLTQSAGQQIAADLSRGVVQGISGYFSKKARTPKVTIKAGHQVFLVSKK